MTIINKALAAISAALFVIKTAFAVPTVMGYPITMTAGLALFIYAFRGDFLILLLWVMIFGVLTALLLAVSFIKAKKWSLGLAGFFIFCQTVILGIACSMAFTQFFQVWINVLTTVVLFGFVLAQLSVWWLRRHYAEVWLMVQSSWIWLKIKAWFIKHFGRTPAAAHHVAGAFAAPGAPGTTPGTPGLPGGHTPPP